MKPLSETTTAAALGRACADQLELQTRAILCESKGIDRLEFIRSFERNARISAAQAWFIAIESK